MSLRIGSVILGGCVYRGQVHVAHSTSIASFAAHCAPHSLQYKHTSNLPQGRILWLREAMDTSADWAVSVDADVGFSAPQLIEELAAGGVCNRALLVAPVVLSSGSLNIYHEPGVPILRHNDQRYAWAAGFGLVAWYLPWLRSHWMPVCAPFGPPQSYHLQGEDIQICRGYVAAGGVIGVMHVTTTHYDCSGSGSRTARSWDDTDRIEIV